LKLTVVSLLLLIAIHGFSQSWKRERKELVGSIGVTSFLGDLGGSASEGGGYGPQDLDVASSSGVIGGGYRYYIRRSMAVRGNLYLAMVRGSDAQSQNPTRQARGLNFRTFIVELSGQYEFYFLSERTKGMYRLRGAKGLKNLKLDAYLFLGLGVFYYNPQNYAEGAWHNLRPLGTEGQTSGKGSKYSMVDVCLPFGLGFKKKVTRKISLGLEFGVRMTATDYIDDVSDTYWHQQDIKDANGSNGDLAAYLANPQENNGWPSVVYSQDGVNYTLQQRGDPNNNDTYFFSNITLSYKLKRRKRSMPKF
jgi:hypothetical protein